MPHQDPDMSHASDRDALAKIEQHEAVCAERYKGIEFKMSLIFHIISWGGASLIGGMAFIIWHLVSKSP